MSSGIPTSIESIVRVWQGTRRRNSPIPFLVCDTDVVLRGWSSLAAYTGLTVGTMKSRFRIQDRSAAGDKVTVKEGPAKVTLRRLEFVELVQSMCAKFHAAEREVPTAFGVLGWFSLKVADTMQYKFWKVGEERNTQDANNLYDLAKTLQATVEELKSLTFSDDDLEEAVTFQTTRNVEFKIVARENSFHRQVSYLCISPLVRI